MEGVSRLSRQSKAVSLGRTSFMWCGNKWLDSLQANVVCCQVYTQHKAQIKTKDTTEGEA